MSKTSKRGKRQALSKTTSKPEWQADFDEVLALIDAARAQAVAAVNTALIDLYWKIGQHITRRIATDGWGQGTVQALAEYIHKRHPGMSGYSARNLWRMMQFFEAYRERPKLSPLVRELSWSHNLAILSRCRRNDEREFYLRLASREHWSFRELQRQLNGAFFERTVLSPPKLSTMLTELRPNAIEVVKDSLLLEVLDLPPKHSEADLQRA
jgi:predicted nuclease of restriction endonuclease-like (RecB) superfamily